MNFSVTLRFVAAVIVLVLQTPAVAQHESHGHHIAADSDSLPRTLGRDLDKGLFEFHARSFYMHTKNRGDLLDYNALAAGAGIAYESPRWKGFRFGFSGFFVFQLAEHNIYREDEITGNTNRYELLLFDMNDFSNRGDLDRLEELFLEYKYKNLKLKFGRQYFDSPFLNEQDNRMRANLFSGITGTYQAGNWNFTGALFDAVTIRGTVEWYSIEDSYGVYPFGRNPFGEPSQYRGNIDTRGIALAGVSREANNGKFQAWNYLNDNVFNLSFLQHEQNVTVKNVELLTGVQGFWQSAVNYGGNEDELKAYILPDEYTYGVGARLGVQHHNSKLTLNYLGISERGRFLFPREWGREQFFASLPRERFEGSGGITAFMMKYDWEPAKYNWKLETGVSKVNHALLTDYKNNKYGIPSYYHFLAGASYEFTGYLEGLHARAFVVHKAAQDRDAIADQFRINRVDMWNMNVIVDYRF